MAVFEAKWNIRSALRGHFEVRVGANESKQKRVQRLDRPTVRR